MSSLCLTSLAPEIKLCILKSLPDVRDVKNLALTSASFYHTFLENKSLYEIDSDSLPLAFAAFQASQIKPWSKAAVHEYLRDFPQSLRSSHSHKWTPFEALRATKLHRCVQYLTKDFVAFASSQDVIFRHQGKTSLTPSSTELRRIQRAFYTFELYCNLFREREGKLRNVKFNEREQRQVFFNKFAPWENEQLGCIHDYLYERFTVPFNDVAEHDVEWGELRVPWVHHHGRQVVAVKEYYLSLGLEFLHEVIGLTNYWDRWKILFNRIWSDYSFLFYNLLFAGTNNKLMLGTNEGVTEIAKRFSVGSTSDFDNDGGPIHAWLWGLSGNVRELVYFHPDTRSLRQTGYVLWDLARIREWGLLDLPPPNLLPQAQLSRDSGYDYDSNTKRRQYESFAQRSEVWRSGGQGWWASGDESHVLWGYLDLKEFLEKEKPQVPTIDNLVRNLSIGEARAHEAKTGERHIQEDVVR